jgi:cellulose biosynthesis protein BcsQ
MRETFAQLRKIEEYDLIVVDTPPALGFRQSLPI